MIDHPPAAPHGDDPLRKMDAYWRAANYLSVGQIELLDNLLLKEPLRREHVKHRLLGHWGTTPALNFIYVHLNRVIRQCDLNVLYVTGPGHGGPGIVANVYLEGTNTEVYSEITRDRAGHGRRRGGGRARRDGARGEPVRDRPADAGEVCRARAGELRDHHDCCPRGVLVYRLAAELLVRREAMRHRLADLEMGDE